MSLTRQQQRALAALVMSRIADVAEFWSDMTGEDPVLADADPDAAVAQLAVWANRLPGNTWDLRLPEPS